jgi:hypothetical protein
LEPSVGESGKRVAKLERWWFASEIAVSRFAFRERVNPQSARSNMGALITTHAAFFSNIMTSVKAGLRVVLDEFFTSGDFGEAVRFDL